MVNEHKFVRGVAEMFNRGLVFSADLKDGVKVGIDHKAVPLNDVQAAMSNVTLGAAAIHAGAKMPPDEASKIVEDFNVSTWK